MMHTAVVKEQVKSLVANAFGPSKAFEEVDELGGIERVLFNLEGQKSVASTNSGTDRQTGLFTCTVFY
jgi:hypothetical protein